jgi:hypothetical protein
MNKYVSAVTDTHAKIEELMKEAFSVGSVPRLYSENLQASAVRV